MVHFGCGFVFTLVTGVSWFFTSCLNMILQIVFVSDFVFTLVTGVSRFFVSCLYYIDSSSFPWFAFLHVLSSSAYFVLSRNLNPFSQAPQVYCFLRELSLWQLTRNCLTMFFFEKKIFFRKTIDFHEIFWKYFFLIKVCFKFGLLNFFHKFAYLSRYMPK